MTEVIRPALDAGRTVVCARFADSTLAYQGYGAGVPLERLRALETAATDGLKPDLTILLDLPVEAGLARKAPGDVTRFEAEFDLAFHRRVRDGFRRWRQPSRTGSRSSMRVARRGMSRAPSAAAVDRLIRSGEPKPDRRAHTGMTQADQPLRLRTTSPADEADRAVLRAPGRWGARCSRGTV